MFTDQQLTGKSGHANIFCLGAAHIHIRNLNKCMHYRKKPGAQKLRKRVRKTLECNDDGMY